MIKMPSIIRLSPYLVVAAAFGACEGVPDDEAIDTTPVTLEAASVALDRLETRLRASPGDPALLQTARQLRENTEVLNGLVDRVDLAPDHSVSFYGDEDGSGVVERLPQGGRSALEAFAGKHPSVEQIYATLAPSRPIPQALRSSTSAAGASIATRHSGAEHSGGGHGFARPPAGEVARVQSALTSADGQFFRDNLCPTPGAGDFAGCLPNWSGGGFAQATRRRSDFIVAPFSGDLVNVRISSLGTLRRIFTVFRGEVGRFFWQGAMKDVPTRSCCFICACPTERLPQKIFMRWDITNASGKGFHWGFRFTNLGNDRDP